ncbi:hypothetical protein H0H87_007658 [Tephrocybe sp. NHM501043]|nr:hypothetical protein H0H87_007658 [Tephrocybe sp. NHM501043]
MPRYHNIAPSHHYNEGAQKLWSIYVKEGEQHDSVLTDTWKVDLDSTLIFAGLFSASVTAFIIESYKLLKPDSGDITNALLAQILAVQLTMASSNTTVFVPGFVSSNSTTLTIPVSAIVVNVLWFLSLASVLTAALIVTLVQQWVRDYLHRTHHYTQPLKRARMRRYLFAGIQTWKLDDIVEYIPTLLHLSLFLFFAGLCVFLANINVIVVAFVGFVVGCCVIAYSIATIAPFFDPSTPFETPLSSIISHLSSAIGCCRRREEALTLSGLREYQAMEPTNPHKADAHAFSWVIQRSTDDSECEALLACIPGFLGSSDGEKTWRETLHYPEIVEAFFKGAASVLSAASPLYGGRMSEQDTKRVVVCLDALFAFVRTAPHSLPPQLDISPLSNSLAQLARSNYDDSFISRVHAVSLRAKAASIFALHKHLTIPSGLQIDGQESQEMHNQIMKLQYLGLEADRKLQDMDTMRQTLERSIREFRERGGTDKSSVSAILRTYLDIVDTSSKTLSAWLSFQQKMDDAANIVLGGWSKYLTNIGRTAQTDLPFEDRLLVSYRHIPHLHDGTWSFFALVIMAYIRQTKVYPPLLPLPSPDIPSVRSDTFQFEAWFPFLQLTDKRWILSDAFAQELHPLAFAFDMLLPYSDPHLYIQDRSKTGQYDLRNMLGYAAELSLPDLPTMGRPFSLWASIAYATAYGCETRALFDLVAALMTTCKSSVTDSAGETFHAEAVISGALRIVSERLARKKPSGSLLFAFSTLQKILTLEHEARSLPFSQSNMDFIINNIFRNILHRENLICLRGCPDLIGTLAEDTGFDTGLEAIGIRPSPRTIPLYDLRDLYAAPALSNGLVGRGLSPQVSGPQWLDERGYLGVRDEEKNNICTRIMEGRNIYQTMPEG